MANGSWSGISGIMSEDMACQESMGPIYDRTREHLGAADRAVIHMRRVMLQAARDLAASHAPSVIGGDFDYATLVAEDGLVEIERPWQSVSLVR